MLKMFSTQLTGVFKRLAEKEEFFFEDGARLLAQAPAGDGSIYIFGTKEMKAVGFEAAEGAEPLRSAKPLTSVDAVTEADRVIIFTRYAGDSDAVSLAMELREKEIPFVGVCTVLEGNRKLADLADVHLDLALTKGLLPNDEGNRFGLPTSMAALFVYYGLKFTIEEILAEYEE